jgi:hypothetical protein
MAMVRSSIADKNVQNPGTRMESGASMMIVIPQPDYRLGNVFGSGAELVARLSD